MVDGAWYIEGVRSPKGEPALRQKGIAGSRREVLRHRR